MAVKYFQTFRPSSQYEAAAAEAERRQALADALAQQSFQPIQVNPAGPMSYTQGLAKILQSYAAGREEKKAKEAQRKAATEIERDVAGVERTGQQLRESLESGRKPLTAAETTPDASGLAMVRGPLDPVRLASTKYGREALVTDPELLDAYKMARMKPTGKLGEVAPDKFTPASLAQYQATGNAAVLVPVEKESKAPTAVQEYEYAVGQGYKGSFRDFQNERARAGASSTVVSYGAPVAGVDDKGNSVFFQPERGGGKPAIIPNVRPKPEAMGQGESTAATFADRMMQSAPTLDKLSPPSIARTAMGGTPGFGNVMLAPENRQFMQAERNFIMAVLRKESGAVISADEYEQARKLYIPIAGDDPETLRMKKEARDSAIAGMARSAGPSYKPSTSQGSASSGGWGKAEAVR